MILSDFQYAILNKCDKVDHSTRQIIFVKGPKKPKEDSEIVQFIYENSKEVFDANMIDRILKANEKKEF